MSLCMQAGSMLYSQWKLRLKLAQGAAAAVAYMHGQRPVLLHSDLKSANFLVTEDFVSKVRNFARGTSTHHMHCLLVFGPLQLAHIAA